MQNLKRVTSLFLAFSFLLISLSPIAELQAEQDNSLIFEQQTQAEIQTKLKKLPAFPEDENRAETDWSEIDWNQEITLPGDVEAYYKEKAELVAEGKYEEAQTLQPEKSRLGDTKTMQRYQVPTEVQELVQEYKNEIQDNTEKKAELKERIKNYKNQTVSTGIKKIAKNSLSLLESAEITKTQTGMALPELDIMSSKIEKDLKLKEKKGDIHDVKLEKKEESFLNKLLNAEENDFPAGSTLKKPTKSLNRNQSAFLNVLAPQVYATETGTTVLMEYYEGIENHPIENILYYLANLQNDDGSFGNFKTYELSSKIALLLSEFNQVDSDQYALIVNYLTNATPETNREKALKARMLVGLEESYSDLVDELLDVQNSDGGIGLQAGYSSDLETTLEFALALYISETGLSTALPNALSYVLDQIQSDGAVYYDTDGSPSLFLTNKTLETLYAFKEMTLDDTTIQSVIDEMLAFLSLRYDDLLENGDIVDQLMTLTSFYIYDFETEKQAELREELKWQQLLNGSFENSLFTTVKAMQALPEADLIITDFQATTDLINWESATYEITIKNQGYAKTKEIFLSDFTDGVLRNDYLPACTNLLPGEETVIVLVNSSTSDLIGNVDYKIFVETENEFNYSDNWRSEILVYSNYNDEIPAVPVFTAQKTTANSLESPVYSVPAISLNWVNKDDPNRGIYVLMLRELGETEWNFYYLNNSWSGVLIKANAIDDEFSYLREGATYELNLASSQDGQTGIENVTHRMQIEVSADDTQYLGSLSGTVVLDNDSASGLSLSSYLSDTGIVSYDNSFELTEIGNGSTFAWVSDAQYEKIKTKVAINSDETTEDVRVFTYLKEDSVAPEITYFKENFETVDFPFKNQHELEMIFETEDNIKVKETDFYLYHPVEDYWEYLASQRDGTSFYWYVPADILGTGYKLKAIAWDYQGNSSEAVERELFEFIDGTVIPDTTAPTITTFEPLYETGTTIKNQLSLRMWVEANDDVELATAQISLYDPVNDVWENLGEEEFSGDDLVFDWTPTADMTGTGYLLQAIALDTQGNESEAVEWGPFEIIDGTDLTGTLTILDLEDATWDLDETKIISWEINSPHTIEEIGDIRLYYNGVNYHNIFENYASGAIGQVAYTMPLESFYVSENAYISLTACDVIANCVTLTSDIFEVVDNTEPPPEPWNIPQQETGLVLDNNYDFSRFFEHIRENPDGTVEVIYKEYDGFSWEDEGEDRRIVYRKLTNGVWSSAVILKSYWYCDGETDAKSFDIYDIEQTETGEIHLAYVIYNHTAQTFTPVKYMYVLNGSKVKDVDVSAGTYEGFAAQVVVSATDNIYLGWREGDANNIYHLKYREYDGSAWSTIERLMNHSYSYAIVLDGEVPIVAYHDAGQIYVLKKENGTWTSPVPVNRPDIQKSKLDRYTADADKLSLIVESDPENADNYLWLSAVRTQSDLELVLTENDFVNSGAILTTWKQNEYAPSAIDYELFYRGNDTFDLFYRNYDGTRSLTHLNFSIDFANSESSVVAFEEIVERDSTETIADYRVIPNDEQIYHVFYNKEDSNGIQRIGHLIFDETIEFDAYVSSLVMDVGDWLFASENDDQVTVYYAGTIAGSTALLMNTADYAPYLASSLRLISPENKANTSSSLLLEWNADETEFDSYDLEIGLNPSYLETIVSETTETEYLQEGLIADITYYWKVVGHNSSGDFSSPVYSFQTTEENYSSTFEFLTPWSEENVAYENFEITWTDYDAEENAQISLYYDTDNSGYDGTLIVEGIDENDETDEYIWSTKKVNEGTYYLYAIVDDHTNEPFKIYSQGSVKISFPECVVPETGDWNITETCALRESSTIYANVNVSSGAVLVIDEDVVLNLDFENYKLSSEQSSYLRVKDGGKIK